METRTHFLPGKTLASRSYHSIEHDLGRRQRMVMSAIRLFGRAASANELSLRLPAHEIDNANTRARLAELKARGLVVVDHVGEDPLSGKTVSFYREAREDEAVMTPEHKASRKELQQEINRLKSAYAELEQKFQEACAIARDAADELTRLEKK